MSEVFGFDEFAMDIEKYARNVEKADREVENVADKMKNDARNNARAGGLVKSGKGITGIEKEKQGEDWVIGWQGRPFLHLYFHELGFHALDNRHGRQSIRRSSKGKRQRSYRGVRATYVPATTHMRPAFESNEMFFYERVQQAIEMI